MVLLIAVALAAGSRADLSADHEGGHEPLDKAWRASAQVDVGASSSSMGQLGLGVELGWMPLPFVRLHAGVNGAWIPDSTEPDFSNHGALRLLVGFDGVLPMSWGELFAGLDSGAAYSDMRPGSTVAIYGDVVHEAPPNNPWEWQPTMRARAGIDFTLLRPLVVGFDAGYAVFTNPRRILFGQPRNRNAVADLHWVELHARISFAF